MSTQAEREGDAVDHAVVGGGLTGLAYALRRRREGRRVVVLEAGGHPGGTLHSVREDGWILDDEIAPIPEPAPHLDRLLDDLPAGPAFEELEAPGRPVRLDARGPVDLPTSAPPRVWLRAFRPRPRGLLRPETLAGFARRRLGTRVAEGRVALAAEALFGTSATRLGATDAYPSLVLARGLHRAFETAALGLHPLLARRVRVPRGGLFRVAEALAAPLEAAFVNDARAAVIHPRDPEGLLRVETDDGRTFRAREVALAVGAWEQARLTGPFAACHAETLASVAYAPRIQVDLGFAGPAAARIPRVPGFLGGAGTRTRGALFVSRLDPTRAPPGHALVQAWLGGERDRGSLDLDDHLLAGIVAADLARVVRQPIDPVLVRVRRRREAVPLPVPGHRGRMAAAQAAIGRYGIRLLGRHVTGVSIDERAAPGTPFRASLPEGLEVA